MAANTELTPMKRQYNAIKEQNQDCILFFRLGDFYEMFDDDAKTAAKKAPVDTSQKARPYRPPSP